MLYILTAGALLFTVFQPVFAQSYHTGNGFWSYDPALGQYRYMTYDKFERIINSPSYYEPQRFTRTHQNVTISVSDSKENVQPGDALTYYITLGNPYESTASIDVRAYIDPNTDFRYASNEGQRTGDRVFWSNVVLYGHTKRTISVTVRVDTTVEDKQSLTFRALAGQTSATEMTTVDDSARRRPIAPPSPTYYRSAPETQAYEHNAHSPSSVLLAYNDTKTVRVASLDETRPDRDFEVTLRKKKEGLNDVIYTLTVENHTNRAFRGVDVTQIISYPVERVRFLSTGGGRDKGDRVSWSLGDLSPYEYRILTLHARFAPANAEVSDAVRTTVEATSRDPALLARAADTVHIGRGTEYAYNYDAIAYPQAGVIDYVFARDEDTDRYLFKPASSPEQTPLWMFGVVTTALIVMSLGAARIGSKR